MGTAQLSQNNILQNITSGSSLHFSSSSGKPASSEALEFSVEQNLYFLIKSLWKKSTY